MNGLFLGHELVRGYDGARRGERAELDPQALLTHAFVCGASGMGKTVFAKSIVEELALSGVPVIAIDLKGDLASLALNGRLVRSSGLERVFPKTAGALRAEFLDGLQTSPSLAERHERFTARVDVRLFTPGSDRARKLAMTGLPTFTGRASDSVEREDRGELLQALARGLCPVRGRSADGRGEREVKFVEELLRHLVESDADLGGVEGIRQLVRAVAEPPFTELGGMPLDEFVRPAWRADLRARLAARITGHEKTWYEGERLDVKTLIGDGDSVRTPIAVLYLGHLSTFDEQANVIAQTCSEVYRWMRREGGSSALRAVVYIDEVGGGEGRYAFYPSAPYNPASKAPLALLVKQGRSAGVGVLLATQNPKSVDVRGLGNIGTWAVGKLTQRADFERIEHLFDAGLARRSTMEADISRATQGEFLLHAPGPGAPRWVRERWLYTLHQTLSPDQVQAVHRLQGASLPEAPVDRAPIDPPPRKEAAPAPAPEPAAARFQPVAAEPPGATRVLPPTTSVIDAPASEAEPAWTLVTPDGTYPLPLGVSVVLGRGEDAQVRFAADTVSRRHVEVTALSANELRIRNLSERNPARVDGQTLAGSVTFAAADSPMELRLGSVRVQVRGPR